MTEMDWKRTRLYRISYGLLYLSYTIAGVGFASDTSPALSELVGPVGYTAWYILLWLGAIFSLFGLISKKLPYVEVIGLIMLAGALAVYAIALTLTAPLQIRGGVNIGVAGLMGASFWACVARIMVVRNTLRVAREVRGGH